MGKISRTAFPDYRRWLETASIKGIIPVEHSIFWAYVHNSYFLPCTNCTGISQISESKTRWLGPYFSSASGSCEVIEMRYFCSSWACLCFGCFLTMFGSTSNTPRADINKPVPEKWLGCDNLTVSLWSSSHCKPDSLSLRQSVTTTSSPGSVSRYL